MIKLVGSSCFWIASASAFLCAAQICRKRQSKVYGESRAKKLISKKNCLILSLKMFLQFLLFSGKFAHPMGVLWLVFWEIKPSKKSSLNGKVKEFQKNWISIQGKCPVFSLPADGHAPLQISHRLPCWLFCVVLTSNNLWQVAALYEVNNEHQHLHCFLQMTSRKHRSRIERYLFIINISIIL